MCESRKTNKPKTKKTDFDHQGVKMLKLWGRGYIRILYELKTNKKKPIRNFKKWFKKQTNETSKY